MYYGGGSMFYILEVPTTYYLLTYSSLERE